MVSAAMRTGENYAQPTLSPSSVLCSILQQERSHYAQKGCHYDFFKKKNSGKFSNLSGKERA